MRYKILIFNPYFLKILKELAKRLQEQEGRPLSIEDRDRLIAIETQDCELAKFLQEKVRFVMIQVYNLVC